MKNYKFILIISIIATMSLVTFATFYDLPAPNKLKTKILDIKNDAVR